MNTKSQVAIEALETLTVQLKGDIAQLTADLATFDGVMLGQGHVVMMSDAFCMKFDITNKVVTNPQQTRAVMATRFTRSDAERIAATIRNGNGENGRAIHVRAAIELQIKNISQVLDDIQKI